MCNDNVSRSSQAFIDWQAHLYPRLLYYLLAQAIFATFVFLATFRKFIQRVNSSRKLLNPFLWILWLVAMPTAPKTPPSVSRTLKASMSKQSFFRAYFSIVKKPYLVFCFLVFGKLSVGFFACQCRQEIKDWRGWSWCLTHAKPPFAHGPPPNFSNSYCWEVCLLVALSSSQYENLSSWFLGLFIGSGGAFMTVYDQILIHSGYIDDQKYVSYLGAAMQVFASIAVLSVSRWIDFTKSY